MLANELPFQSWLGAPITEVLKAQRSAFEAYIGFLTTVCFPRGRAEMLEVEFEEPLVDCRGNCVHARRHVIRAPLVAVVTHPNMQIHAARAHMDLEVTEAVGERVAAGAPSVSLFKVRPVTSRDRRRRRDARRVVHLQTAMVPLPPPEGLHRLVESLATYYGGPTPRRSEGSTDVAF